MKTISGVADSFGPQSVPDWKNVGDLGQVAPVAVAVPGQALLVRRRTLRTPGSDGAHVAARCGPAAQPRVSGEFNGGNRGRVPAGGRSDAAAAAARRRGGG